MNILYYHVISESTEEESVKKPKIEVVQEVNGKEEAEVCFPLEF